MSTGKANPKSGFSEAELTLLNNALNEILNGPGAIPAAEFQTRTGVERATALALLSKLGALIDQRKRQ